MGQRLLGGVLILWLIAACRTTDPPSAGMPPPETAPPAYLMMHNWDTYISPAILTRFEEIHGVDIRYRLYETTDSELLLKLPAAPAQYDLLVVSNLVLTQLLQQQQLARLNKENVPNMANIDEPFANPVFDPGNSYCAPYQWGTIGIGYNIEATGRPITSVRDLFDPAFAGRVALLDEPRFMMGLLLLYEGYSPNTTRAREIDSMINLIRTNAHGLAIAGDNAQDLLLDGTYDIVIEWSGDILQVMEKDDQIRYAIPEEGSIIWTDSICVSAGSPHRELAEAFIDYLLEPEIGAELSAYTRFATPNRLSLPLLPEEDRMNGVIYPSPAMRQNLFYLVALNMQAEQLYQTAWDGITAVIENH